MTIDLEIDFLEAAKGIQKQVEVLRVKICGFCKGN